VEQGSFFVRNPENSRIIFALYFANGKSRGKKEEKQRELKNRLMQTNKPEKTKSAAWTGEKNVCRKIVV